MKVYELRVYKRAYKIAIDIHKLTQQFPKTEQYGGIADQIRRSSRSIVANIVEGYARSFL